MLPGILTPSIRNGQKRLHVPQSSNPERSWPLAARVRKIRVLSALMISGLSGSTRGTYLAIFQKMIKWNSEYRSKLVVKKKKKKKSDASMTKGFFGRHMTSVLVRREGKETDTVRMMFYLCLLGDSK